MIKGLLKILFASTLIACQDKQDVERFRRVEHNFYRENAVVCGFATADFNNDGKTDVAVGDLGFVRVYLGQNKDPKNKKELNFVYLTTLEGVLNSKDGGGACGLAAVDFDNDGKTDLIVGDVNSLRIFYNRGKKFVQGPFLTSESEIPLLNYRESFGGVCGLDVFGLNKKGNLEIILKNANCSTGIYEITGNKLALKGTLIDMNNSFGNGNSCSSVAVCDLDNDYWLDLIVSSNFGPRFFRNLKNDKYEETHHAFLNQRYFSEVCGFAAADFDNDGIIDLLVGKGNDIAIYFQENGSFTPPIKMNFLRRVN